jgi:uncharacterized protein YdaU (DUF1376 family)
MSLPFMPFYWGDYWRDTAHLSDAEHVSYLRLISHYWQHGSLPVDASRLARIAGRSASEWAEMAETLKEFFSDGWHHARIERDLMRQKELSDANSERAKKAANARWNANSMLGALPEASLEQSLTNANQNQNHNQNYNHNKEPDIISPKQVRTSYSKEFELFWDGYPRDSNMSKKEAFSAWKRISDEDRKKATEAVPHFSAYCKANPDYRPIHAVRFLTKARWEGFLQASEKPRGGNRWGKAPHEMNPQELEEFLAEQRAKQHEARTNLQ